MLFREMNSKNLYIVEDPIRVSYEIGPKKNGLNIKLNTFIPYFFIQESNKELHATTCCQIIAFV